VTLTLDASAAFALLAEDTPERDWLRGFVVGHDFVVPMVFRFEVANLVRRHFSRTLVSGDAADNLFGLAQRLPVAEFAFDRIASRAWALRGSYSFTDASYIAVAEATRTRLVTLDSRLSRGPAVGCEIVVPPV
jgi:predicted nucleic acid-binding protein